MQPTLDTETEGQTALTCARALTPSVEELADLSSSSAFVTAALLPLQPHLGIRNVFRNVPHAGLPPEGQ